MALLSRYASSTQLFILLYVYCIRAVQWFWTKPSQLMPFSEHFPDILSGFLQFWPLISQKGFFLPFWRWNKLKLGYDGLFIFMFILLVQPNRKTDVTYFVKPDRLQLPTYRYLIISFVLTLLPYRTSLISSSYHIIIIMSVQETSNIL
jgi:hypothetical protein